MQMQRALRGIGPVSGNSGHRKDEWTNEDFEALLRMGTGPRMRDPRVIVQPQDVREGRN